MIRLKFIDGVLYQSKQMSPGGNWTDYNPVPSEVSSSGLSQGVEGKGGDPNSLGGGFEIKYHKHFDEDGNPYDCSVKGCAPANEPKAPHRKSECTEIHKDWWDAKWDYCARCGVKRPKPKSLAEKFEDAWHPTAGLPNWNEMVQIAEQHFIENK